MDKKCLPGTGYSIVITDSKYHIFNQERSGYPSADYNQYRFTIQKSKDSLLILEPRETTSDI